MPSFFASVRVVNGITFRGSIRDDATIHRMFQHWCENGGGPNGAYAIGYNYLQQTWWTNPLSLLDLEVNSVYDTYRYEGLPPTPIANPSLGALNAVAFPAETPYYYFRARCDGSGFHEFAETFDEHLLNACP